MRAEAGGGEGADAAPGQDGIPASEPIEAAQRDGQRRWKCQAHLADPASASLRCSPPWGACPDRQPAVCDTSPSCAGCRGAPPTIARAAHRRILETHETLGTEFSASPSRSASYGLHLLRPATRCPAVYRLGNRRLLYPFSSTFPVARYCPISPVTCAGLKPVVLAR